MKKGFLIAAIVLILLYLAYFVGTGLIPRTDVILLDYEVSDDGSEITLHCGVASSMGYIRGYSDRGGGVKPHYLTFYSAFGGLNSRLGAQDTFTLTLHEDDTEIRFVRSDGYTPLVLAKNTMTGVWERASES